MKHKLQFDIYEVCRTLSLKSLKKYGFFSINDKRLSNKYNELLYGILHENITNDRIAKDYLGYSNQSAFQRFKHRFVDRIKSFIFIIDAHKKENNLEDDINKKLWREIALAKILLKTKNQVNSRALLERVFAQAKKYDFYDILIVAVPILRQYFAFMSPDKIQYQYYSSEYNRICREYFYLQEVRKYYDDISHIQVFSHEDDTVDIGKKCLDIYEELRTSFNPENSVEFRIKSYQMASFGYLVNNEYSKSIHINEIALKYLDTKPVTFLLQRFKIYKDILSTKLKMGNYEESLTIINDIEDLGLSYNFNYFNLQALKFQVNAMLQNFNDLYILCYNVTKIKELKTHNIQLEQWKIKTAFVSYLVSVGKIDEEIIASHPMPKFRLKRFLNDIEIYSKDKRGANIAVHIVELLFYLKEKNKAKILDRLDSLTKYSYRYLRNDSTLRSNCFIKMLLKLPEADYNPIRTQRYVSKYQKKLNENPLEITLKSTEVEIIPYEQLWEMVIDVISPRK